MSPRLLHRIDPHRTVLFGRGKELTSAWKIDHTRPAVFIGSCFSDVISTELSRRKVDVSVNPQGVMFNPISIAKCVTNIVTFTTSSQQSNISSSIFQDKLQPDLYHSWDHSQKFSDTSVDRLNANISTNLMNANHTLKQASSLFLTLGTSIVHLLSQENGQSNLEPPIIVSNCHKQPHEMFSKRFLNVDEIVKSLSNAIELALNFNSDLKVALTVSPVRHTREGLIENQRSKAALILAVQTLCEAKRFRDVVNYFPSYEFVMDELRDYRWYSDDLVHLSRPAEEMVFALFEEHYMTPEARSMSKDIVQALHMVEHRPIVERSKAYTAHLQRTLAKLDESHLQFIYKKSFPCRKTKNNFKA